MSPDHDGPVSGMVYIKEDKVGGHARLSIPESIRVEVLLVVSCRKYCKLCRPVLESMAGLAGRTPQATHDRLSRREELMSLSQDV